MGSLGTEVWLTNDKFGRWVSIFSGVRASPVLLYIYIVLNHKNTYLLVNIAMNDTDYE